LLAVPGPSFSADNTVENPPTLSAQPNESGGAVDTFTMVLDDRVQPILGKEVRSSTGETMGRIVDVIVDRSGRPRAAVIDFGGFLGVGSRRIVLDWRALHFSPPARSDQVTVDLSREQVKAAPEFKSGKPVVVVGGALKPLAPDM
jgi:hypothetical protein